MKADDSRRFCFPCSEAEGTLVRRVCPSLEQQRAKKREAQRVKAKQERDRELQRNGHLARAKKIRGAVFRLKTFKREEVSFKAAFIPVATGSDGVGWHKGKLRVARYAPSNDIAHKVLHLATESAVLWLREGAKGPEFWSSYVTMLIAASAEDFGFDEKEFDRIRKMTARLKGQQAGMHPHEVRGALRAFVANRQDKEESNAS